MACQGLKGYSLSRDAAGAGPVGVVSCYLDFLCKIKVVGDKGSARQICPD